VKPLLQVNKRIIRLKQYPPNIVTTLFEGSKENDDEKNGDGNGPCFWPDLRYTRRICCTGS
jgi:hypothetical protein